MSLKTNLIGKGLLLALISISVASPLSAGTSWYVSTMGSDTNSGTSPDSPFAHVQAAMNQAAFGDTVNIQAGVYREQVLVTNLIGNDTASTSNMLVIQAWDTNADGIIEPYEMPTIDAFQLITNWTPVTDPNLWAALTGGLPYQSNAIFSTLWSTNLPNTGIDTIQLVMESDTNALVQSGWNNFRPGNYAANTRVFMTNGTFQYNVTNHTLYVWRYDGNMPGPANPIQAACLDPGLPGWGEDGPFVTSYDYISLKGIIFRHSSTFAIPGSQSLTAYAVHLNNYSRVENCDIQWMAGCGLICGYSMVTNSIIGNNAELGLQLLNSNVVVGCMFTNNNWRQFENGSGASGGVVIAGYPGGALIANNTFANNLWMAIHGDTAPGTAANPCVISNNFIYGTNINLNCQCETDTSYGILLELASYYDICNNVMATAGNGILCSGSKGDLIVNNSVSVYPNPQNANPIAFTLIPNLEFPNNPYPAANNIVANNIFASYCDEPVVFAYQDSDAADSWPGGPLVYNNVFAYNVLWNYLPATNLTYPPVALRVGITPYPGYLTNLTDVQAWAHAVSGTDAPFQNVGNTNANPLFVNPGPYVPLPSNKPVASNTISGFVTTSGGVPVGGVVLIGSPNRAITDSNGYYSAVVPQGWSGTVTPSRGCFGFSPATRAYDSVTTNLAQNYTGVFSLAPGVYTGLFYETNAVRLESSGSFSMTVTPRTNYSAVLHFAGARYSWTGKFDASGAAGKTILRRRANPLTVTLALGAGADGLSGTVSDGSWTAQLNAGLAVFKARNNPAPFAGRYAMLIPGSTNDNALPSGAGRGKVAVTVAGNVALAGLLADGAGLSTATTVLRNGQWPLFKPLYGGQGLILSWMTFDTNLPPAGFEGSMSWIRPPMRASKSYPAGFDLSITNVAGWLSTPAVAH